MIRKLSGSLLIAVLLLLITGCVEEEYSSVPDYNYQPVAGDKLTAAELNALTLHARKFVSKSPSIKLNKQQRNWVARRQPEVAIRYYGKKYGYLRMSWRVASNATLELYGTGKLTAEYFPWKVRMSASQESHPVPDGMLENFEKRVKKEAKAPEKR
ncbi:MAG: hypothetical protein J6Q65_08675 [Lentisphaeria bacterium]|nr:hypothetical protein [Lentisphaeria bacterium]